MTATGFIKDVGGFTCGNQSEADVKRKVIEKADNVILLLDSSKVNKKTDNRKISENICLL